MTNVNILAVEDNRKILEQYYAPLSKILGTHVDLADSEDEATEKIRCRAYDIALIDISLVGDHDESGIDILKRLNNLNEGTDIIVVSGTTEVPVTIKAYDQNIKKFLWKHEIDPSVVRALVERLISDRNVAGVSIGNSKESTDGFLYRNETERAIFEDRWVKFLGISYRHFPGAIKEVISRYGPILSWKGSAESLIPFESGKACFSLFWSRRLGFPILLMLGGSKSELQIQKPHRLEGDLLEARDFGDLAIQVWKIPFGLARSEFDLPPSSGPTSEKSQLPSV